MPWSGQDILGPTITRMFDEVGEYLERQKVKITGPGIALWHESQFVHTTVDQQDMDIETALPIGKPVPESGRIKVRELPKGEVAYTVHNGDFSGLPWRSRRCLPGWRRTAIAGAAQFGKSIFTMTRSMKPTRIRPAMSPKSSFQSRRFRSKLHSR